MNATRSGSDEDSTTLGIKVTKGYRDYLRRLAQIDRGSIADLIDRAVSRYAAALGHEQPPRR
jgi:hypothetical protein